MLTGFKRFVMRGNVLELAVAVVIGAAFAPVVASFVTDVLMPPIGLLLGHASFVDLFVSLDGRAYPSLAAAKAAGAATINYGAFITTIVNFVIIAFAVFVLVSTVNRLQTAPAAPPAAKECPLCVSSIPLRARRCPHCAADLAPPAPGPAGLAA